MEAKNLEFSYDGRVFIDNINLKLNMGEITTILGPNGSGKSTILNLFAKQLSRKSGVINLGGKDIDNIKDKYFAKELAIVYQQNSAPMDLTVEKLVSFGRTPYKNFFNTSHGEDEKAIKEALISTNLYELRHKEVGQLSGGQRQRAFIAMALAQNTGILFLDEPTTYLDIFYQLEILELVKELNEKKGITIVMVLHDINQALQYSHNIIIMKDGRLVFNGKADEAITRERVRDVYGIDAVIKWCPVNCCKYMTGIQIGTNCCKNCEENRCLKRK